MSRQTRFYNALLSDAASAPDGLLTCNASDPAVRFAVYRNNVLNSLVDALADTFPVVQALVGEAFFRAMARCFVQAQPPSSPLLVHYGEQLPAFIAQFEPAASLPYLANVARLEVLRVRAYHAADACSLNHEHLSTQLNGGHDPAHLVFRLHPSLHLLSSPYAVYSLWAAHQGALRIEQVDPYRSEQCLVLRQQLDVLVIAVDVASAAFIGRLHSGVPLGVAAASCPTDFDISQCLAMLIRQGAISAVSLSPTHE